MNRLLVVVALVASAGDASPAPGRPPSSEAGFVLERDSEVAKAGPGPHSGKGQSVGYVFFEGVPGFRLSFRKRVLHPGASIGYHKQDTDEVYYVIGGAGEMNINNRKFGVRVGDAVLTRTGSSHGLVQTGTEDLAIVIAYEK